MSNELVYLELAKVAESERQSFAELLKDIPYERKGILYSEMFFLWLCARDVKPKRILESGRARGQSTLILATIFPDSEIISIEHDKNSPDVQVATERLAGFKNVRLLFGDSTSLLPEMVKKGSNDIVLIDGPKGFRGLRLAFHLLDSKNVSQVFVHDTTVDTEDRNFLERYLPHILYSDNPILASKTHQLDNLGDAEIPEYLQFSERKSYGYSLSYMKADQDFCARKLLLASYWTQFASRVVRKFKL